VGAVLVAGGVARAEVSMGVNVEEDVAVAVAVAVAAVVVVVVAVDAGCLDCGRKSASMPRSLNAVADRSSATKFEPTHDPSFFRRCTATSVVDAPANNKCCSLRHFNNMGRIPASESIGPIPCIIV